jgi:hypothetical protein
MAKLPLVQGAYEARATSANSQRCINLFGETNPKDSPWPVTHYPASGLSVFADYSGVFTGAPRGLYWASNGALYAVIGTAVIQQTSYGQAHLLVGNLDGNSNNPVVMSDNGTTVVLVDGSNGGGWTIDLATNAFAKISDPAFYGSNRVDFIDTFFVFNRPGTRTFYTSNSNAVTFDPLYYADKIGFNDVLVSFAVLHDNIWLLGTVTSEVWFNSGAADFPFQRMPNSTIQQGCVAPYAVAVADNALFWLSQDRYGRTILLRGEGYAAKRVSTFAVEDTWAGYLRVSDARAMVYQQAGHEILLLWFPLANATWALDTFTGFWHRRTYGAAQDAWLPCCSSYWGSATVGEIDVSLAGDRTAPRLLAIDRRATTDAGTPIQRIRSWPHVLNDQKRMSHNQFVAAMQPGQLSPDQVSLRWSDDGGQTFGQPLVQTAGGATNGQYSWRRLGMARDRVYELSWTAQGQTALHGAWIEAEGAET